ncbi:MAG: hypothetical protein IH897_11060 [Planctomycetes bacterium]|nr:hypothetical protein [Planctomycetota bacterium]
MNQLTRPITKAGAHCTRIRRIVQQGVGILGGRRIHFNALTGNLSHQNKRFLQGSQRR